MIPPAATLEFRPGDYAPTLVARVLAAVAACTPIAIDRLSDAQAAALAVLESIDAADGRIRLVVDYDDRALTVGIGVLDAERATAPQRDAEALGVRVLGEALADESGVEDDGQGGERLALRFLLAAAEGGAPPAAA